MLHHIQKSIISALVENDNLRFSALKPPATDGNIFTYHLKQLMKDGYVEKSPGGDYMLTSIGKRLGIHRNVERGDLTKQAHSIFLVAARNEDGAWLLRKRLVQPARGYVGFIHGEPEYNKPVILTAQARLRAKSGLDADLETIAQGYIRIFLGGELESFTHTTLLTATNIRGKLLASDATGENFWAHNPDFSDSLMLPSMPLLTSIVSNPKRQYFFDETYTLVN